MDMNQITRENVETSVKEANGLTSPSPVAAGARVARLLLCVAATVLAMFAFSYLLWCAPVLFDASTISAFLESEFSGFGDQCLETLNALAPPAILLGIVCTIVRMLRGQGD